MARLAAKARCNYYPLPDREAELIRSCLTFPDQQFSGLDPCAGAGRAMAVITASSPTVKYGIELDSYCAEAATRVERAPLALDDRILLSEDIYAFSIPS
jgi:hypothetical protein